MMVAGAGVVVAPAASAYDNWCTKGTTELLAEIWSTAGVTQPPTAASVVSFSSPVRIDAIMTYHWNAGGDRPGKVTLVAADGTQYGPWAASGSKVLPADKHFCAYPNQVVPAGTYTVIDSQKRTWSQVDGRGMLKIFGASNVPPPPAAAPAAGGTDDNWCKPGKTTLLAEIWSTAAVTQPPTRKSRVRFSTPVRIDAIMTYHWNANGQRPGTIKLVAANGKVYGPWKASGSTVVPADKHFCAYPKRVVPAGTYTVVDSRKATWSQVDGPGMLKIFGERR